MKIVFFGTPEFAVPGLKTLVISEHEVLAVVCEPVRQSGRGRKLTSCPVKEEALRAGIPVSQPLKVTDRGFFESLKKLNPSALVVVAYGQIFPSEIIHLPEYGCVNIHASLLPKYRGASPINWAIIHGDKETGVTTMLMDEGMDTGPVLMQQATEIFADDTAGTLSPRLSAIGAELLIPTLQGLGEGTIKPRSQGDGATYSAIMNKSDGFIRWSKSAEEICNFVRGMNPWPGAYGFVENQRYKILKALPVDEKGEPGVIVRITKDDLIVGAGDGVVSVREIQPSGKPVMTVGAFLQGRRIAEGMRFSQTVNST